MGDLKLSVLHTAHLHNVNNFKYSSIGPTCNESKKLKLCETINFQVLDIIVLVINKNFI